MKLNYSKTIKIMTMFLLIMIVFMTIANVSGVTTQEVLGEEDNHTIADAVKTFLGWMLKITTGPLMGAIATFINVILAVIFMVLALVFSPLSNGFSFPFPDQIIFNRVYFFDPNFINPTENANSPVYVLNSLIKDLYQTGFVIAGAVFVIAAMIIGIKLAISTIASEKAHYKQALGIWITGLLLLFTTHFIMLAIFTINEEIVANIAKVSTEVEFTFPATELVPAVGHTITNILHGIEAIISAIPIIGDVDIVPDITTHGYSGLIMKFAVAAWGGNIVGSIICAILLGQTCALIYMYLKRMFFSMMLGMIAPLIVAVDVIKKAL